jgi:hypothetical protein
MYGMSARPKLPEGISKYAWKPDARAEDHNRRSVYVYARRNMRFPLFDVFDLPDQHNSCARRSTTTTAPQALLMLNSELTLERAQQWAGRLLARFPTKQPLLIEEAFRTAWCRPASQTEIESGLKFISRRSAALRHENSKPEGLPLPVNPPKVDWFEAAAIVDFCHAILNSNEFLYVD